MVQWLEHLKLLQRTWLQFPAPTWWIPKVCFPVPGDSMPSSDLLRHQAHMWYRHIHGDRHLYTLSKYIIKKFYGGAGLWLSSQSIPDPKFNPLPAACKPGMVACNLSSREAGQGGLGMVILSYRASEGQPRMHETLSQTYRQVNIFSRTGNYPPFYL